MRYMVLLKSDETIENSGPPSEDLLNEMGKFNASMVKAGVLVGGEGLHPSRSRKRVTVTPEKKVTVVDGPFAEAKELIAGFWILDVPSIEDAVEWISKAPSPYEGASYEIGKVMEPEDFGEAFSPEMRDREQRLRDRIEEQHG